MPRTSSSPLLFASQLSVERGGEEVVGPARFELLRQIDACGSITAAAQAAGVSYRTAWLAVDALNNLAGEVLVERAKGGAGGGGAKLTAAGRRLVDTYATLQAKQQEFLDWVARGGTDIEHYVQMLGRLSLRTSARNQVAARVQACADDGPGVRVTLRLTDGQTLVAQISRRSRVVLGIEPGLTVVAVFKINALMWAPVTPNAPSLAGTVAQVDAVEGGYEVTLALPGGATVHGWWHHDNASAALVPRVGQSMTVWVDPAAVLLAIAE